MKQPGISRRNLLTTAAVGVPAMGVLGAVNLLGSPAANARTVVADGWWGTSTTMALQDFLGVAPTGRVDSQPASWAGSNPGLASGWEWVPDDAAQGAHVIRSLQWYVGVDQDGLIGPATIRALQAKFGQTQDGILDGPSPTIQALQSRISGSGVLT
jgi:prophage pi2 protein 52, muramidase